MGFSERRYSVNGLDIAALCHGESDGIPVLALHGWLDNAASFDLLAPMLNGCHVVAIDLPGHGHSSHRFPQGSYNVWDDLLDLLALVDQLGWQQFHLLGHSRGGMIATLLAAVVPERVVSLNLLDGIVPKAVDAKDFVGQLQNHVRDFRRAAGPSSKIYADFDEALQARCKTSGMSEITARPIVERGLEATSLGLRWRHDTRVMAASALKLTQAHVDAVIDALRAPTLLLLAGTGMKQHFPELMSKLSGLAHVQVRELSGSHHFQLEAERVGEIAQAVLATINSARE